MKAYSGGGTRRQGCPPTLSSDPTPRLPWKLPHGSALCTASTAGTRSTAARAAPKPDAPARRGEAAHATDDMPRHTAGWHTPRRVQWRRDDALPQGRARGGRESRPDAAWGRSVLSKTRLIARRCSSDLCLDVPRSTSGAGGSCSQCNPGSGCVATGQLNCAPMAFRNHPNGVRPLICAENGPCYRAPTPIRRRLTARRSGRRGEPLAAARKCRLEFLFVARIACCRQLMLRQSRGKTWRMSRTCQIKGVAPLFR